MVTFDVYKEMISQRISQGFQLVTHKQFGMRISSQSEGTPSLIMARSPTEPVVSCFDTF